MSARRPRNIPPEFTDYFAMLLDFSDGGPDRDTRERLLAELLSAPAPVRMQVGAALLDVLLDLRSNVEQASNAQAELRALCARLTAPPWHVATLLRVAQTSVGPRAVIAQGQSRRVIGFADEVDPAALIAGDDVFLSTDMTLLTGVSPYLPGHGETAVFVRHAGDGRVVVSHRDEELLLETSGRLDAAALEVGDVLRIERMTFVAHERLAPAERSEVLFERVADLGAECVGGQQTALKRLLGVLAAKLLSPERAAQYGIGLRRAVLLYGPPGNGKTLMAKVATAAVQRLSGGKAHFAIVKPAQFESPYVGQTEANMRTCFRALLRAAQTGPAVLFLDEVDAIGRVRGLSSNHHGDRFLDALLAELDGFADRGSIAIIAATNRKDLLDPALLQRLTDVEVRVPRPDADAARSIFAIHLPASLPFDVRTADAEQLRSRAIENVVTRLYAPNAESELCTLKLRDGKSRGVRAAELVSGRILEQIARSACEGALLRELDGGMIGVRVADVDAAVDEALERMGTTITSRNAHAYLEDLPEDADVVKVERPSRKRPRSYRYLAAA